MADPAINLADVAVLAPLGMTLTYRVPDQLVPRVTPGSRVLVELRHRRVLAMVVERHARENLDPERLKEILHVVDQDPILPPELLSFTQEVSRYYVAPLGEVMQLALPAVTRDEEREMNADAKKAGGRVLSERRVQFAVATDTVGDASKIRATASAILAHVRAHGAVPVTRLVESWPNARNVLRTLAKQNLVTLEERALPRDPFFRSGIERDQPPTLTAAQAVALDAIHEALGAPRENLAATRAFLLHGVTGSGKTEVYLRAIEAAKAAGKGSLVLVPEIALTPQLVNRFRARFGDDVAVLHSGLNPKDRHAMWLSLRRGDVDVAIGARSALFAPVPRLGLVLVDEEHDGSFKQEEGVRYHARDMAILRANRAGAVCILGSATPSLEAEYLARTSRLTRLSLPDRAHSQARLPDVTVVDLRHTDPGPSKDRRLSIPLHRAIEATLGRKEQVILFLNRRGFAPSVVCNSCGNIATCTNCSVALTYHRRHGGELRCHYCDNRIAFNNHCPTCNSPNTFLEGAGTERLEEVVAQAFPDARVDRLDRDVASGGNSEAVLDRLRRGEVDILVGTQMVAKGHDLPNVTLVGVINADASLCMPDFRASERAFHLLVQVAGRAGRHERKGQVIFQTRDPAHPALSLAAAHDVHGFLEHELKTRAELMYPPFARLALVRIDGPDEEQARNAAQQLADHAHTLAAVKRELVCVLGPAPAPIARLRGRFRFRILLKAKDRPPLRNCLLAIDSLAKKLPRDLRVVLDVDPVSML